MAFFFLYVFLSVFFIPAFIDDSDFLMGWSFVGCAVIVSLLFI